MSADKMWLAGHYYLHITEIQLIPMVAIILSLLALHTPNTRSGPKLFSNEEFLLL